MGKRPTSKAAPVTKIVFDPLESHESSLFDKIKAQKQALKAQVAAQAQVKAKEVNRRKTDAQYRSKAELADKTQALKSGLKGKKQAFKSELKDKTQAFKSGKQAPDVAIEDVAPEDNTSKSAGQIEEVVRALENQIKDNYDEIKVVAAALKELGDTDEYDDTKLARLLAQLRFEYDRHEHDSAVGWTPYYFACSRKSNTEVAVTAGRYRRGGSQGAVVATDQTITVATIGTHYVYFQAKYDDSTGWAYSIENGSVFPAQVITGTIRYFRELLAVVTVATSDEVDVITAVEQVWAGQIIGTDGRYV